MEQSFEKSVTLQRLMSSYLQYLPIAHLDMRHLPGPGLRRSQLPQRLHDVGELWPDARMGVGLIKGVNGDVTNGEIE